MRKNTYSFSDYDFNADALILSRYGTAVPLRPQAAILLKVLLESAPEHVSRKKLHAEIWHERTYVDVESALNALVRELRSVLGKSGDNEAFITTLPKRGYQFSRKLKARGKDKRPFLAVAAVLLVATSLTIANFDFGTQPRPAPSNPVRLAILPVNLPASSDESSSTGFQIAMRLTASLRDIPSQQLKVIGTDAVQNFGNNAVFDPSTIGAEYLLETTISPSGEELVVEANLKSVMSHASQARFLRTYPNHPSLVTRAVPEDVAAWIRNHFGFDESPASYSISSAQTAELVDVLIRARWARESDDIALKEEALDLYNEVLQESPRNVEALRGKLILLTRLASYPTHPVLESYSNIERLALSLREIGDTSAGVADLGLAFVKLHRDWDIESALRHSERSLMLDPQNAEAHTVHSAAKAVSGDLAGAIKSAEVALRIRPNTRARSELCWHLLAGHHFERAQTVCGLALEASPGAVYPAMALALARYQLGDEQSALDIMIKLVLNEDPEAFGFPENYPGSWREFGCRRAEYYTEWFESDQYDGDGSQFTTAAYYWAQCGDRGKLLHWTKKATQAKGLGVVFFRYEPRFESWLDDPDFRELLQPIYSDTG